MDSFYRDTPPMPLCVGRMAQTCGWALKYVRANDVTAIDDDEKMRLAIGDKFLRETGKSVAHVRRMQVGDWPGGSLHHLRFSPLLGGQHAPARFLIYWNDPLPAGWWPIPVGESLQGGRRGSLRRDVRNWLNSNTRRGTVMVVALWEITSEGDGIIVPAVAFENQTDAALFRISWL
jgi:hypothetical protein